MDSAPKIRVCLVNCIRFEMGNWKFWILNNLRFEIYSGLSFLKAGIGITLYIYLYADRFKNELFKEIILSCKSRLYTKNSQKNSPLNFV